MFGAYIAAAEMRRVIEEKESGNIECQDARKYKMNRREEDYRRAEQEKQWRCKYIYIYEEILTPASCEIIWIFDWNVNLVNQKLYKEENDYTLWCVSVFDERVMSKDKRRVCDKVQNTFSVLIKCVKDLWEGRRRQWKPLDTALSSSRNWYIYIDNFFLLKIERRYVNHNW